MNAIILIDFGMTASAAECLIVAHEFGPTKHYTFDKTPTQLLYGEDNEVIAWGSGCKGRNEVISLFKSSFGARNLPEMSHSSDHSLVSQADIIPAPTQVDKWVSDYLHHFCCNVLDEVLQEEHIAKELLNAKWYLTTPGCWSDSDRRDFKMLAEKIISDLLPGSKVDTDITESQASCEFLVSRLKLAVGTWAITCDIGGATCDTALAVVQVKDGRLVPVVQHIATTYGARFGSVVSIDDAFAAALKESLPKVNSEQFIKIKRELMEGTAWPRARHDFDGTEDVVLTAHQDLGKFDGLESGISINGFKVTIPRRAMENMFEGFLKGLYTEIDESFLRVAQHKPSDKPQVTIALCGGGGTMTYLLKQLKLRYDNNIEVPSSTKESCLATIMGHSMYRVRYLFESYFQAVSMGLSDPFSTRAGLDPIIWEETLFPLPSQNCNGKVTQFTFSTRKRSAKHYFVIHRKQSPESRPAAISKEISKELSGRGDGILIWTLNVTLGTHFIRQKYCIKVLCTGIGEFKFKAHELDNPGIDLALTSVVSR